MRSRRLRVQQSDLAARIANLDCTPPRVYGPDFLSPGRQQKLCLALDVPGTLGGRDHFERKVRRAFEFSRVLQIEALGVAR